MTGMAIYLLMPRVALLAGQSCGGVNTKTFLPGWFLAWVWIAPPYRRQGLLKRSGKCP